MSNAVWGGLFFIVISVYLLKHALRSLRAAERSHHWPSTTGQIKKLDVIRFSSGRHCSLFIDYTYSVYDQQYVSTQAALYTLRTEEILDLEKKYSCGSPIDVFYDSDTPAEAILLQGANPDKKYSDCILASIGLCIGIAVSVAGYYGFFE